MKRIIIFLLLIVIHIAGISTVNAFEAGDIEIHGFISQGYLITDKNNYLAETEDGTFQFNEMGINVSADATDDLHISLQIFSRDLGDTANNEVVIGYAYGDYRWQNWLGLRAGKIKIDYGLYNETREMDMLRTAVMLPQSVYPEIWRDSFSNINGIAVYGYVPGGLMGKFSYDVQIGAMAFDEEGGFAKYLTPRIDATLDLEDMDSDYAWFGNLQWIPVQNLKTKGTFYSIEGMTAQGDISLTNREGEVIDAAVDYDFKRKDGYAVSLEYIWKNLILCAEYAEDTYDFDVNLQTQDSYSSSGGPPKITSQGWYVSASYRFTDWFETALSYSEYYPNKDNKDGRHSGSAPGSESPPDASEPDSDSDQPHLQPPEKDITAWLKTTTLSARFDINESWILKLEASYNDGFGGINLAENPDGTDENWYLFAAKLTFSF